MSSPLITASTIATTMPSPSALPCHAKPQTRYAPMATRVHFTARYGQRSHRDDTARILAHRPLWGSGKRVEG